MNRCLRERALLDVFAGEGSDVQHAHLRTCADCAERYDALVHDMHAINGVLAQAPPALQRERRAFGARVLEMPVRWVPAAVAAVALLAIGLNIGPLRPRAPTAVHSHSLPAFAADVSAALFAADDDALRLPIAADAPYLQAALDAGQPCTQEAFDDGECDDQVLSLVVQSD